MTQDKRSYRVEHEARGKHPPCKCDSATWDQSPENKKQCTQGFLLHLPPPCHARIHATKCMQQGILPSLAQQAPGHTTTGNMAQALQVVQPYTLKHTAVQHCAVPTAHNHLLVYRHIITQPNIAKGIISKKECQSSFLVIAERPILKIMSVASLTPQSSYSVV